MINNARDRCLPSRGKPRTLRRVLLIAAKVIAAAILILWMVRSGRLDLHEVIATIHNWPEMAAVAGLCYVGYIAMAVRWRFLLVHQGIRASFRDTFALSMIGAMFSTMIPGAVSGDVAKAYFVSVRFPEKKTQAVTTILLDRYVGLTSLLVLSAVAGAWNSDAIEQHSRVSFLYWVVVVVACIGLGLPVVGTLMSARFVIPMERLAFRFPKVRPIVRAVSAMQAFYRSPRTLALVYCISFTGIFATCLAFYVVGLSIGGQSVSPAQMLFVVPLGLTAIALPISPAGLGVGQTLE